METDAKIKEKLEEYIKKNLFQSIEGQDPKSTSKYIRENGLIGIYNYEKIEVRSLWSSWSVKRKTVWFWKNKLGFGKKEIYMFEKMRQFVTRLGDLFYDEFHVDLSVDSYGEFDGEFRKYWYENTPKNRCLYDFDVILNSPAESVVIKGRIDV